MDFPQEIFGVDFSGAANAGRHIWICAAEVRPQRLKIQRCLPAAEFLGCPADRDVCLAALRNFMAGRSGSVFALDFPFGLPQAMAAAADWTAFVCRFPARFSSPQQFREFCRETDGGSEMKRRTDRESRAPFSPYNLRIFRQTYYGIREILAPLVAADRARVLPMQPPHPQKPWVLETCPASLLKKHDCYAPYKGPGRRERQQRGHILKTFFLDRDDICLAPAVPPLVCADRNGDGLDSLLTAAIAFHILQKPGRLIPENHAQYQMEGFIYF